MPPPKRGFSAIDDSEHWQGDDDVRYSWRGHQHLLAAPAHCDDDIDNPDWNTPGPSSYSVTPPGVFAVQSLPFSIPPPPSSSTYYTLPPIHTPLPEPGPSAVPIAYTSATTASTTAVPPPPSSSAYYTLAPILTQLPEPGPSVPVASTSVTTAPTTTRRRLAPPVHRLYPTAGNENEQSHTYIVTQEIAEGLFEEAHGRFLNTLQPLYQLPTDSEEIKVCSPRNECSCPAAVADDLLCSAPGVLPQNDVHGPWKQKPHRAHT